ncbi:MAG: restriction endonuclease [Betaproteobacteria bacterium]|nr:restriction endonuclease [Betaproteobacteria bacterium]
MKFEMHKNSLFAVLLRSRWWVSFAVAIGLFAIARLFIPEKYVFYAMFFPVPFVAIGCMAAWRQLQAPSASRIAQTAKVIRGLSWGEFADAIELAYRNDGFTVNRLSGGDADFETVKGGRIGLVSCKRWKAARTGVEPLRELDATREKRSAHECTYMAIGEVSVNAVAFAKQKNIHLFRETELARLLPRIARRAK